MIKEINALNWDFMAYFKKRAPELAKLFNFSKKMIERSEKLPNKVKETILEEIGDDLQKNADKFKIYVESLNTPEGRRGLRKAFGPIVNLFKSSEIIYERPLYYEAVVSVVTAFETYIRDTIIDLVSNNRIVEKRFSSTLMKKLNYEKIKDYNYEWDKIMGYIVSEEMKFFECNDIERNYREALGKNKNSFSLFKNENQKKRIQNFLSLRHIIVHNGGIIDHKFKKETKSKYNLGEPYPVSKKYIINIIGSMKNIVEYIEELIANE